MILLLLIPTTNAYWYNVTTDSDTYIAQLSPNGNFGTSSDFDVGEQDAVIFGDTQALIHFNLSSLTNVRNITYAEMKLRVISGSNAGTINIKNITSTWSEGTVTWNTKPTNGSQIDTKNFDSGTTTWFYVNNQSFINNIKYIVASGINYGWIFIDPTLSVGQNTLFSSRETLYDAELNIQYTAHEPGEPISPSNSSTIYYNYPPQTNNINFTWYGAGTYGAYNLKVAEDVNFNLVAVDTAISTNYSIQTLTGTKKYWWKVREYNSSNGSYGAWSEIYDFNLTSNATSSGKAGVQGVVYELIAGIPTPISGATVYLYNNSISQSAITGSNGYYLFDNLSNSTTYSVYAQKQGYDTTAVFPVTTGVGTWATNDILMRIYISPYVPNFVFEKFIVRGLFDNSYSGVTVTTYKDDDVQSYLIGTTDTMGQAVFQLIKDQRYRVTFSGGGIGTTITVYIYAKEESYYVRVLTGFPTGGDRYADISTNLTSVSINSTWSNLTLIYNDTRSSTSVNWFYAKNLTTNVTCYQTSTSSVVTLGCPVYAAGLYQFGFNATSSIYGTFQEDKVINFDVGKLDTPSIEVKVDKTLLNWGSVIIIVFTAALFSVRSVKFGAVIVPLEALVLWVFGWFEPLSGNAGGSFILLSIATVLGVMVYLRQSEVKVNY